MIRTKKGFEHQKTNLVRGAVVEEEGEDERFLAV